MAVLDADKQRGVIPAELRARIDRLSLDPLWESRHAHKLASGVPDDGCWWRWSEMRPMMLDIGRIASPEVVERRVLSLIDRHNRYPDGEGSVGSINAAMQMLKPGERARPHRHTMNALRFVLESAGGAHTVVDGKDCSMEAGDLVLTPAWTWHAHCHDGTDPVIWLDILDVSLHRYLGVEVFQPGPVSDEAHQLDDRSFAAANLVPVVEEWGRDYSPVFRYPWAAAAAAVDAAPLGRDGRRQVRYANPLNGGSSLATLDSTLIQIDPGARSMAVSLQADSILCVRDGGGTAVIGETSRAIGVNDVLTVPTGRPLRLISGEKQPLRLLSVTNSPVFRKLGFHALTIAD